MGGYGNSVVCCPQATIDTLLPSSTSTLAGLPLYDPAYTGDARTDSSYDHAVKSSCFNLLDSVAKANTQVDTSEKNSWRWGTSRTGAP